MKKVNIDFVNYDFSQIIPSGCNSITFINVGNPVGATANVWINDVVLLSQGQQLVIEGNEDELISQAFKIRFAGAGAQNLAVVKKVYL